MSKSQKLPKLPAGKTWIQLSGGPANGCVTEQITGLPVGYDLCVPDGEVPLWYRLVSRTKAVYNGKYRMGVVA